MLYIGSDHRGFELKQKLVKYLDSLDIECTDLGYSEFLEEDDYNDITEDLVKRVRLENYHLGILLCGSGVGVDIVANKHALIRSALCFNVETAKRARQHEAANIMCLPADFLDFDTAKEMVLAFIKTPFSFEEKHVKRLNKILKLEANGLA